VKEGEEGERERGRYTKQGKDVFLNELNGPDEM